MSDPRLLSTAELAHLRVVHSRSIEWARVLDHLAALEASIPARERSAFVKAAKWAEEAGEEGVADISTISADEALFRYPDPQPPEAAP